MMTTFFCGSHLSFEVSNCSDTVQRRHSFSSELQSLNKLNVRKHDQREEMVNHWNTANRCLETCIQLSSIEFLSTIKMFPMVIEDKMKFSFHH